MDGDHRLRRPCARGEQPHHQGSPREPRRRHADLGTGRGDHPQGAQPPEQRSAGSRGLDHHHNHPAGSGRPAVATDLRGVRPPHRRRCPRKPRVRAVHRRDRAARDRDANCTGRAHGVDRSARRQPRARLQQLALHHPGIPADDGAPARRRERSAVEPLRRQGIGRSPPWRHHRQVPACGRAQSADDLGINQHESVHRRPQSAPAAGAQRLAGNPPAHRTRRAGPRRGRRPGPSLQRRPQPRVQRTRGHGAWR
ncbi:unannotated protein [freshwater metagenome]|uniref:Unannotated protein n=1 Tax=freshwater metagenome TaxID=449393 RepID=A0A6J7UKI8_9ZZZZ